MSTHSCVDRMSWQVRCPNWSKGATGSIRQKPFLIAVLLFWITVQPIFHPHTCGPKRRSAVLRRRGALADPVSEDDITRSIKKLKCLGGGLDLVTIGSISYVRSVPGELNLDKNRALELAQVGLEVQVGWQLKVWGVWLLCCGMWDVAVGGCCATSRCGHQ